MAENAQQYLQQQRHRHTSLAAGEVTVTSKYLASYPAPAPDLSKCAVGLAQPTRLVLLELPGQRELGSWPLPKLTVSPAGWRWDASSRFLAAPWGRAWDVEYMIGQPRDGVLDDEPCGMSLVDTSSWSTSEAALGFQEAKAPVLGPWSPCGLALVRHLRDGLLVWTLYSPSGSAVHSVTWTQLLQLEPGLGPQHFFEHPDAGMDGGSKTVFAPAGSHLLLSVNAAYKSRHYFTWAWQAPAIAKLVTAQRSSMQCWAPDGTQILHCEHGYASFFSCMGAQLARQQLPEVARCIGWAASALVWSVSGTVAAWISEDAVHVFTVQAGPGLVLSHSLKLEYDGRFKYDGYGIQHCMLSFSPDGMHLSCLCAWRSSAFPAVNDLAVFAVDGQRLGVHELQIDTARLPVPRTTQTYDELSPIWYAWSPSGTRMAVTFEWEFSGQPCVSLLVVR